MAEERRVMAARDLAKKLRLESKLKKDLGRFFKKLGNSVKRNFIQSRTIINADAFQPELRDILEKHYRHVMTQFQGDVINNVKQRLGRIETKQDEEEDATEDATEEILTAAALLFIINQSKSKAALITSTNNKEIKNAFQKASQQLTVVEGFEADVPPRVLASDADRRFIRSAKARIDNIAITETQSPAEEQKANEMKALLFTGAITSFSTKKEWTAILDNVVRDAHFKADGQVRNITEAYEVGGEVLMKPGDTSLGATAKNVARCRCSSNLAFPLFLLAKEFDNII